MQVTGMSALGYKYSGALDALQSIVRTEGVKGLYRGLWPNLRTSPLIFTCAIRSYKLMVHVFHLIAVKVAPSIATSFFTYELVKESLGAT